MNLFCRPSLSLIVLICLLGSTILRDISWIYWKRNSRVKIFRNVRQTIQTAKPWCDQDSESKRMEPNSYMPITCQSISHPNEWILPFSLNCHAHTFTRRHEVTMIPLVFQQQKLKNSIDRYLIWSNWEDWRQQERQSAQFCITKTEMRCNPRKPEGRDTHERNSFWLV